MSAPIAINARFLTRNASGVDRFASEILREWLPRQDRVVRAVLPANAPAAVARSLGIRADIVGSLKGHAWEQLDLPRHCRRELMLNLCSSGPLTHRLQLVVLHDANTMANPWIFSLAYRSWYRMLFAGLMRRAGVVATVSKFSASELVRHVGGRAAARIEVISESGEHVLRTPSDPAVLERLGLLGRRYVLAVGNRSPNKNLTGVAKAAALLTGSDVKVVAVGGSNDRVFASCDLSGSNLMLTGYVTDGQLRALYENALCFVYPSFYEGFGIPPLEAMHCGCPVVASDNSAIPEICGDAALYCDPADPADIAHQVQRVLDSAALRDELRQAGHERVRLFTWARAAQRLEEVIHHAESGLADA
ncbi:MAG: glycosyltransferase family 1 protein [Steroidobacteraceae bacterium]